MNEGILARNFSPFIGGRLPQKVRSAARLPERTGGADGGIRRFYRQICGKLRPSDRECSLPPFDGKQQIMVPSIRLMSIILETGQQIVLTWMYRTTGNGFCIEICQFKDILNKNGKGVLKMSTNLYSKENVQNLGQLKDLAPEPFKAFHEFNAAVFKDGALSKKEKEIIAVAVTHVTLCPDCIDAHTKEAKKEGASLEELAEAVFVAAAVEAGGTVTHSTHVHNAKNKDASDALYARSNLRQLGQLGKLAPDGFKGYQAFSAAATKAGKLSAKFKEIIAVAVANAIQCPYCIDVHTKNAERQGAIGEELAEAIMVTAAVRAGDSYAHMANMIQSYQG